MVVIPKEEESLDGSSNGSTEGSSLGSTDGSSDGSTEGSTAGSSLGSLDGTSESSTEGSSLATLDGSSDGSTDGSSLGSLDGSSQGSTGGSTDGSSLGSLDGLLDGSTEGDRYHKEVAIECVRNGEGTIVMTPKLQSDHRHAAVNSVRSMVSYLMTVLTTHLVQKSEFENHSSNKKNLEMGPKNISTLMGSSLTKRS